MLVVVLVLGGAPCQPPERAGIWGPAHTHPRHLTTCPLTGFGWGLTAADDAEKLQFQMNVLGLKAAQVVPIGGPTRDT